MFKWFTKKNNVIPTDINSALLTSGFYSLKLNAEVAIPKNVICFVSYKDRLYCEKHEDFAINNENLGSLISRQSKRQKNKPNKIDVDLFFVNTTSRELSFIFKDKISFNRTLNKVDIKITINLAVENAKKFLSFVLSELSLPRAEDTEKLVKDYIVEQTKFFFLRKNLSSPDLDEQTLELLCQKMQKFLNGVGVKLIDFDLQISTNAKFEPKKLSIFDNEPKLNKNIQKESQEKVDQEVNLDYNKEESRLTQEADKTLCPVCGQKVINGSIFCHRCGAVLK